MDRDMEVESSPQPTPIDRASSRANSVSRANQKLVAVRVNVNGNNNGRVIMIPEEVISNLKQKQTKKRVPSTSLSVPPSATYDSQPPQRTQYKMISPKNILPSPETTKAQSNSPPWSNPSINTDIPTTIQILPNVSAVVPVFSATSHNATRETTLASFGSRSSTVTLQNSTITTLKNLMSMNPGIAPRSQTSTIQISNNGNSNPGMVSGPPNYVVTTMNSEMLNNVVGLTYNVPSSLPSNTSETQNMTVLPQSSSMPLPQYTIRKVFRRAVTTQNTSEATKSVVCPYPTSVGTTPSTTIINGPRTTRPDQPQNVLAKCNGMSNKVAQHKILEVTSSSGGNTVAGKYISSKIAARFPTIAPNSFPNPMKMREVITPRVQPDGSVLLERTKISWTKEGNGYWKKSGLPNPNQFTLSEVNNNPLESGVAKKYVVYPTSGSTVSTVPLLKRTTASISSKSANTSSVKKYGISRAKKSEQGPSFKKRTNHPSSLLPIERYDIDPPSPVKSNLSSDKSTFQWHQPYTGEPPSVADEPEAAGDSATEKDPVSISDDPGDDDDQPAFESAIRTDHIARISETEPVCIDISDDDDNDRLDLRKSSQSPLVISETHSDSTTLTCSFSDVEEYQDIKNDLALPMVDPEPKNDCVSISGDEDRLDLGKSSPPTLVNSETHSDSSMLNCPSSNVEENQDIKHDLALPRIDPDSTHPVETNAIDFTSSKSYSPNLGKSSGMVENSRSKHPQHQTSLVNFNVEYSNWTANGSELNWPTQKTMPTKKKKKKSKRVKLLEKKKKKKACLLKKASVLATSSSQVEVPSSISGTSIFITDTQQVCDERGDIVDSETEITECVPFSSRPPSPSADTDPSSAGTSITRMEQSLFQWHHPCTDTNQGKSAHGTGVAREVFKTQSFSDAENEQGRVPLPLAHEDELKQENTEDTAEVKFPPCSDAEELSIEHEQDVPRIEPESVRSVAISECAKITSSPSVDNEKRPSCKTEDEFVSSRVAFDGRIGEICSAEDAPTGTAVPGLKRQQKERKMLNKMQLNLTRRVKATAEGIKPSAVSMPSKRTLAGGQDEDSNKTRKKTHSATSSTSSDQYNGQISNAFKSGTDHTNQKDSSGDKIVKPNVLRDCIVRKTIQDCYSKGVIPTIDMIHSACCDSGLDFPKHLVEPHFISIGYNWVTCNSERLIVENHRFATERIKYLNKLKKYYEDNNLVYIFVSDYVEKSENGWQVSPNDVDRSCPDSAHVVLHAASNKGFLEGSLEVLKLGRFGLICNDVVSWLKCYVIPNIPEGSIVALGHHPVFDKNEESEERPDIGYSKEKIISWLTSHKVTPISPNLPKAMLLSKVDNVILPKTSVFDKLLRHNGFVSLHLPKHHKDLNPIEFLWRDILEKLYKTPEIQSECDFEGFVAREFSSCSQKVSSVACELVRKFECAYREFDLRFDELLEKVISVNRPVTSVTKVIDVDPKKTDIPDEPELPTCPVCLKRKKLLSFRCNSCKAFWNTLSRVFRASRSVAGLPVCSKTSHLDTRPPECKGCRRHRYEVNILRLPFTLTKIPRYVLPIPPVTEEGKQWYSPAVVRHKKTMKRSNQSSSSSAAGVRQKKRMPKRPVEPRSQNCLTDAGVAFDMTTYPG